MIEKICFLKSRRQNTEDSRQKENTKYEIRNSKQIQITKISNSKLKGKIF